MIKETTMNAIILDPTIFLLKAPKPARRLVQICWPPEKCPYKYIHPKIPVLNLKKHIERFFYYILKKDFV